MLTLFKSVIDLFPRHEKNNNMKKKNKSTKKDKYIKYFVFTDGEFCQEASSISEAERSAEVYDDDGIDEVIVYKTTAVSKFTRGLNKVKI